MSFSFGPDLKNRLTANLRQFDIRPIDDPDLRQAAVAIVVGPNENDSGEGELAQGEDATVLLTLRPRSIRRHAGQYALPGGRLDDGETTIAAALRELDEELGLRLPSSSVIGMLDDYPTRSGFRITPVVAWVDSIPELTPAPDEVYKVFRIPLGELNSPEIPILSNPNDGDHPVLSMILPVLGHEIFAPTAAILFQFREVALRGAMTRVAHYDQPGFAWK